MEDTESAEDAATPVAPLAPQPLLRRAPADTHRPRNEPY